MDSYILEQRVVFAWSEMQDYDLYIYLQGLAHGLEVTSQKCPDLNWLVSIAEHRLGL